MATGDQNDFFTRLKSWLPNGWFPDVAPLRDALLQGAAAVLTVIYQIIVYVRLQTRIGSATDGWLDIISTDFFGTGLPRNAGEKDGSFRARIIAALFQERATRRAYIQVLTKLTGYSPIIFEPARPMDTGAMNAPTSAGYCGVARMGSIATPYTLMVTAFRPYGGGGSLGGAFMSTPQVSAMNTPLSASYTNSLSLEQVSVTDANIYAAIDKTRAAGITAWVNIQNHPA